MAVQTGSTASPCPRALGSVGTPTLAECPDNDEERERRQRRRSRVMDRQLDKVSPLVLLSPACPRGRVENWQPALPRWSNAEISEHYSACIKLSSENKINMKNAFGLHLIDYMAEILKSESSDITNFKVAAGTLDASTKIYAGRVDAVHAETYRVLGSLGKEAAPAKDVDSPDEEDSAVPVTTKKVQIKKKQSKTIEQNVNNLNVSEANRRRQVDPMFQRAAASFDGCSGAGIFLTLLRVQDFHSELKFDSEIVPLPSSKTLTLPSSEPVKVADLKSLLAQCTEKRPICSSLAGFQFTKWDAESCDESVSALLEKFKRSEQVFDINAEIDSDEEDCAPALPDDDFHLDSPGNTDRIGEFIESIETFETVNQNKRTEADPFGDGDIRTMSLHLSMNPGEYSYFSPRILSMWAGPKHWHFRPQPKSDADSEKQTKKRTIKKAFKINFEEHIDFEAYFCMTKVPLTLAKSTLEKRNLRSITLPPAFDYDPKNLCQLFLKPAVKLSRRLMPVSLLDNEAGIDDYDYNNPRDTSDFCPAVLQDEDVYDDDDDDPADFLGQTEMFNPTAHPEGLDGVGGIGGVNVPMDGELSLIAEPQKVRTRMIQYARTAKRMDMKVLKTTMWEILTGQQEKRTVGEVEGAEKEEDVAVITGEKVFSDDIKELLHRLPSSMATNLSVSLAFFCLLHLANEKNLELEGTEDLSDILVRQNN